jgi:hypothetical protein
MGKILLFTELERIALNKKDVVLFGERDWINDGDRVYDLFFHSKSNVEDVFGIDWPVSLVVPVIRGVSENEIPPYLAELNETHPEYCRFAIADNFLDFYDVVKRIGGREVNHLGKYVKTARKKFFEHIRDPLIEQRVSNKIREIEAITYR